MKNRKLIYTIITLLISVFLYLTNINKEKYIEQIDNDGITDVVLETDLNYLPTSTTHQIIKHTYYTLSYNEKYEQAEWVAYKLTPKHIKYIDRKRPYFIFDKKVKTKSANYKNYKKSGYDKGHLVPAGDMRFSFNAFNDTFYTSNISPQNHQFNAGLWNRLEQKVRYWTKKYGNLYIITGGVLKNGLQKIGEEHVAVPNQFYKIILNYSNKKQPKVIAFLMPNRDSDKPLYKFTTSIDEIEKLTGIDFFPALTDKIENRLESKKDYKGWSFITKKSY